LIGSLINIPLKRVENVSKAPLNLHLLYGLNRWFTPKVFQRNEMIIAINVGGCVVPLALTIYQLVRLFNSGIILIPVLAISINVIICYHLSEIKAGVGIFLPAFVPGMVAALCGLILTPEDPAPIAFCAGILGPLIGADLLRLN